MNFLFVLNHPAHFHLFKNPINLLLSKGHRCKIIAREKDVLANLLHNTHFDFTLFKETKRSRKNIIFNSTIGLIKKDIFITKFIKNFKADMLVGTDWSITHVGRLFNIPSIVFNEDDTKATPENKIFYPLAHHLILPDCCDLGLWGQKRISYAGYHELAYLHPNRFTYEQILVRKAINSRKPYIIIRIVKLTASHDIGKVGLSKNLLKEIIKIAKDKFEILISFEGNVVSEFEKYNFKLDPNLMHQILAGAHLVVGDSQTMIAEAAVLGKPAIRFNDFVGKLCYLEELETKYKLAFGYKTNQKKDFLNKVKELLYDKNINEKWQQKLKILLKDKIDVSKFFVWLLENYPVSIKIMQENPDYQYNFR